MAVLSRIQFVEDFMMRMAWVNDNVLQADTEFPRARYAKTILWVIVHGKRMIEVGGALFEVQAGDLVVIPPQTQRAVLKSDPGMGTFHYYSVGCDIKIGSLHFTQLYNIPVRTPIQDAEAFQEIAVRSERLSAEAKSILQLLQAAGKPKMIVSKVNMKESAALLALNASSQAWFALFFQLLQPSLQDKPREIDPRISELCAYMQQHLRQKLTMPDLAKVAFLSESHLRLLFRKTMGMAPMEYLKQLRLQRAKDLLVNSSCSLEEVADLTGFAALNQFSRIFSSQEGISASSYRKRYTGGIQG
ncbi:HTH-type transcriptional activator RhaR [Paenibacillus solanacearum]|uniref:HTH-type transcriptional activator RhaR n=1 Tax=Paenibacillus solanacearum TaxID=2048548 RepID=A0A916NUW2_9BACL|nr:HTH-type transcriptional activator RhaR [Paenibacillus solanacearum]